MKSGAGRSILEGAPFTTNQAFYSDSLAYAKVIGISFQTRSAMQIPQGNTREDIKARRLIIKDFYYHWMQEHPEKKVWNKTLGTYINVSKDSVNEILGHAPRSFEATSAQMHLTKILSEAKYLEKRPPKFGDKNQKKFSKMLFLKWKSSRILVGQCKTNGEYELYYISGGQKNKAVR